MIQNLSFDEAEKTFEMNVGEVYELGGGVTAVVDQTETGVKITVTDAKGTTSAEIKNGEKGEPGKTPVKGVDYFTEEDIQSLGIEGKADKEDTYTKEEVDGKTQAVANNLLDVMEANTDYLEYHKADKTIVAKSTDTAYAFEFSKTDNKEVRLGEVSSISFTFGNGEYSDICTSGLSFDSGATPTAIDYTDSGILNWVNTDCTTVDGLSIFQPSANTHYDIVFYFNGTQFIGLVNGFVPSVSR